MADVAIPTDTLASWRSLLALWPESPWEFGERLAVAYVGTLPPDSTLARDAGYVEDVMQAAIRHMERLGADFGSGVDVMVLHDGARRATGELPRQFTAVPAVEASADAGGGS